MYRNIIEKIFENENLNLRRSDALVFQHLKTIIKTPNMAIDLKLKFRNPYVFISKF